MCTNNILVKWQYVFSISSSTENSSCIVINEMLKAANNRLSGRGTLCDLETAFDCVNRGIVVDKLEFSGITGTFLNFI